MAGADGDDDGDNDDDGDDGDDNDDDDDGDEFSADRGCRGWFLLAGADGRGALRDRGGLFVLVAAADLVGPGHFHTAMVN